MTDHVVGTMLLIRDVRDNTVNIITAAELTQSTPVDLQRTATAAASVCVRRLVAMYVTQTCVFIAQFKLNWQASQCMV